MSIIYEEVECQRAVTVAEYFAEKCVREGNSLVDVSRRCGCPFFWHFARGSASVVVSCFLLGGKRPLK